MPGPVLHEGDQIAILLDGRNCLFQMRVVLNRMHLFEQLADILDDLNILFFAFPAHIIGFPDTTLQQDQPDRFTVVIHIEPVPHILPVAIDRKALPSTAFRIIRGMSFSGNWYGP